MGLIPLCQGMLPKCENFMVKTYYRRPNSNRRINVTPLARIVMARMEELGLKPSRASKDAGLGSDAIRDIIRGKNLNPGQKTLVAVARILQIDVKALIIPSNVSTLHIPIVSVPLVSWVEAGDFSDPVDPYEPGTSEREIQVPSDSFTLIALEVQGDSMNRIAPEGATIIVDYAQKQLTDGRLYVVKNSGGATFKRFRANPDRFEPFSTADHKTIFPDGPITIVGRVTKIIQDT